MPNPLVSASVLYAQPPVINSDDKELLAAATVDGHVAIWDMSAFAAGVIKARAGGEPLDQIDVSPRAVCVQNVSAFGLTHLHLDAWKIVFADKAQTVGVFDILSLKSVRMLPFRKERERRSAAPLELAPPSSLIVGAHQIALAVGNQIKVWDVDAEGRLARLVDSDRKKKRASRKSVGPVATKNQSMNVA